MLRVNNLVGYGAATSGSVSISGQAPTDQQTSPTDAYAGYRLNANGKAQKSEGIAMSYSDISGEWLTSGSPSTFECRATLNSGTLNSGTTGSWLALSSTRQWDVTFTADVTGSQTANLTIEIRRIGSTTTLDSATVALEASVEV